MTSYLRTTDVEACTLLTEVPPNLGKVFQRTWESTPLCVEVQPQMLHSHEELDLSGEYVLQKNTKFKGANVNCNSICLEICKGEMADSDDLAQVMSSCVDYRDVSHGTARFSRPIRNIFMSPPHKLFISCLDCGAVLSPLSLIYGEFGVGSTRCKLGIFPRHQNMYRSRFI